MTDGFVAKYAADGDLQWVVHAANKSLRATVNGVDTDSQGNTYVTGMFEEYVDLFRNGNLESRVAATPVARPGFEIFVAKISAGGFVQWATALGGHAQQWGSGIEVHEEPSGNTELYIWGQADGGGDLDPSDNGTPSLQNEVLDGYYTGFLASYDVTPSGLSLKWLQAGPTAGARYVDAVYGEDVTEGRVAEIGTAASGGFINVYSRADEDLNHPDPDPVWGKQDLVDVDPRGVTIADDYVYVSGFFRGNPDLNGDEVADLHGDSGGAYRGFVAKYSPAGNLVWAQQLDGTGESRLEDVAISSAGTVYASVTIVIR